MIPAIPDAGTDGIDPTTHRVPFDAWEITCLNEIIDARQERRPVSFKVPVGHHGEQS